MYGSYKMLWVRQDDMPTDEMLLKKRRVEPATEFRLLGGVWVALKDGLVIVSEPGMGAEDREDPLSTMIAVYKRYIYPEPQRIELLVKLTLAENLESFGSILQEDHHDDSRRQNFDRFAVCGKPSIPGSVTQWMPYPLILTVTKKMHNNSNTCY